jgi:hypothetical protein
MAGPEHSPPAAPDDWISLCQRELQNVRASYVGKGSNDTKIDHSLKALEAILKAIIWKKQGWEKWPKPSKGYKYLFNHDLDAMLDQSGLRPRLRADPILWPSWQTLMNVAVKQYRYSPTQPSDDVANEVAKIVRDPDTGIVTWLTARFQEMK